MRVRMHEAGSDAKRAGMQEAAWEQQVEASEERSKAAAKIRADEVRVDEAQGAARRAVLYADAAPPRTVHLAWAAADRDAAKAAQAVSRDAVFHRRLAQLRVQMRALHTINATPPVAAAGHQSGALTSARHVGAVTPTPLTSVQHNQALALAPAQHESAAVLTSAGH